MTFHIYTQAGAYVGVADGLDELAAIVRAAELYERSQADLLALPYFLGHQITT